MISEFQGALASSRPKPRTFEPTSNLRKSYNTKNNIFCMSCFHESYTRWRLAHKIIGEDEANRLLNYSHTEIEKKTEQVLNRRSAKNATIHNSNNTMIINSIDWWNETLADLTDLTFPNVSDWKLGGNYSSNNSLPLKGRRSQKPNLHDEKDLATIFKLYEETLEIAIQEINDSNMNQSLSKLMLGKLISDQKEKMKDEIFLLMGNEYFVIDRPYGLLVYSLGSDQQLSVDKYLADFYMKTIKDIVQILDLTEDKFKGHIPSYIKNKIFEQRTL